MADMVARGRNKVFLGASNNLTKLTDEQVIEIKEALQKCWPPISELANKYNVSFQCIWRIGVGLSRQHVGPSGRLINPKPVRKLSVEEVMQIRKRVSLGELQSRIADEFGIWPATVSQIARLVKRKDVPAYA